MSTLIGKCPECESTKLKKVHPTSRGDFFFGNQSWKIRCENGHEFEANVDERKTDQMP